MNTRIITVVAALTLLTFSGGCSGMRNFLFGRGARCGLCNRLDNQAPAPNYNTAAAQPCAPQCPPAPQQNMVVAPQTGCGCNGATYAPSYGAAHSGNACGCGVGQEVISHDPYMNGVVVEGDVVGNGYMGDWEARRYDAQGDLIVSESVPVPTPAQ